MKTNEEIKAEIQKLKEMKPRIVEHTFFGDSNWDQIDAQIHVLRNRMDRDDAHIEFSSEDKNNTNMALDGALEAVDWMNDEPDSLCPSGGWESLAK